MKFYVISREYALLFFLCVDRNYVRRAFLFKQKTQADHTAAEEEAEKKVLRAQDDHHHWITEQNDQSGATRKEGTKMFVVRGHPIEPQATQQKHEENREK